jgi:hypothetical protein
MNRAGWFSGIAAMVAIAAAGAVLVGCGSQQVAIPNVVGQDIDHADRALFGAGFRGGKITMVKSDTVPYLRVIRTDPSGSAPEGTHISLVFSDGPTHDEQSTTTVEPPLAAPHKPTPTSFPTPPPTPQHVQRLDTQLPSTVQGCEGHPALYNGTRVTVDTNSTECTWLDNTGQNWDLAAWQFESSADAESYFTWLVQKNSPNADIAPWARPAHPAASGQNFAESGSGTVWWVLPSQNIVYSLVTTGDDTGAIALAWWARNVN